MMNKRIKELMIKSGAYDHYEINEGVNGDELPMVKFAELIVKECLEWCDAYATVDGSAKQIRNAITQYFEITDYDYYD